MRERYLRAEGARKIWLTPDDCRLEEFIAISDRRATAADYPLAR